MKSLVMTLLAIPVFVFGSQHYLEYMGSQGEGESYERLRSDTVPVLVPEPQSITWHSDSCFIINNSTVICRSNSADTAAAYRLQQEIIKSCSLSLQIVDTLVSSNSIILRRRGDWQAIPFGNQPAPRPQAYFIRVNPDYCVATGDDADGLYYGVMTLKQLIAQHEGNYVTGLSIYDYPDLVFRGNRMRYYATDLDSMKIWAEYFASLKLNKLILESGHFWTSTHAAMVDTFFNWCRHYYIEPIPLLQSFGHGGNVLSQNPACGEAVYRKDEHFCFLNDTARCLDDTTIFKKPELLDMGFDSVSGNNFTEWEQTDIGVTIFSDGSSQHAGEYCVKISRTGYGTSRLWQDASCDGNTLYRLSFFIKTQGVSGIDTVYEENPVGVYIEVYGDDSVLIKQSRAIRGTQDWEKVSVVFNSGTYTDLRVYVGMYYAQGTAWIDGERLPVIENAGFEDQIIEFPWVKEEHGGDIERTSQQSHTDTFSCMIRRLPGNDGYSRVYQDIEVEPGYDYRLSVWVKTVDVDSGNCFCTAFWVGADTAQYWRYRHHDFQHYGEFYGILKSDTLVGTSDWVKISTNWFSSVHCEKIRVKLALDGTGTGYFDDVLVEKVEKSLVNVDPTTSIKLTSETGIEYQPDSNYQVISGPNLTWPYSLNATPTKLRRLSEGTISDSQIVLVSYDKLPAFQVKKSEGYYPYCPTKQATRDIMNSVITNVSQWNPRTIHFGHDEIAFMKEDQPCLESGYTRAGLLAYDLDEFYDRLGDTVDIMIWEDMLNPYHMGKFYPDDPTYYAADSISTNIIPVIWFYRETEPSTLGDSSINYFESKEFRTIAAGAGYHELNSYNWAGEIKHRWIDEQDTSCYGIMNCKWGAIEFYSSDDWRSLPTTLEYTWQWPDTAQGRVWDSLRYDPITLHRHRGDIFVPRPTGLGFERLSSDTIRLFWHANRNLDLKEYKVYRDSVYLATTTDTFYTDSILSGIHRYQVTGVDSLDNESPYSRECVLRPLIGSIAINNDQSYCNLPYVALNLNSCDPTDSTPADSMQIWQEYTVNDTNYTDSTGWVAYDTVYFWYLREGEGSNEIAVQYKIDTWNYSVEYCDSIVFDKTLPTGSFVINDDSTFANNSDVTLKNSLNDTQSGMSKMRFGNKYLKNIVKNSGFDTTTHWQTDTALYHDSLRLYEIPLQTIGNYFYQAIAPESLVDFVNDTLLLWIDLVSDGFVGDARVAFQYIYGADTAVRGTQPYGASITIPEGTNAKVSHYNLYSYFKYYPDPPVGERFIEARVGVFADSALRNSGRLFIDNFRLDVVSPADDYTRFEDHDTLKEWTLISGNGVRKVYGQFSDGAGNETAVSFDSIIVDTTKPARRISYPQNGQTISDTITITGWAHDSLDDPPHFKQYELQHQAQMSANWYGNDPDSISYTPKYPIQVGQGQKPVALGNWNTYQVNYGWYNLKLTVSDSAGNSNDTTISVNVSNEGDGDGKFSGFSNYVYGLAAGNQVYIGEFNTGKIYQYNTNYELIDTFKLVDSVGTGFPLAMAMDHSGKLWVANSNSHLISKFTSQGSLLLRFAGGFSMPSGFAFDNSGNIWVSDRLHHKIKKFNQDGDSLFVFGTQGTDPGEINRPIGLAYYDDKLYVADSRNKRISVFDTLGNFIEIFADSTTLSMPFSIVIDSAGCLFVSDFVAHRVLEYDPFGNPLYQIDTLLDSPTSLALSPDANILYVSDTRNKRVLAFQVRGEPPAGGGPQAYGDAYIDRLMFDVYPSLSTKQMNIRLQGFANRKISLKAYDVTGRVVKTFYDNQMIKANQSITWDCKDDINRKLANGVYFVRLVTEGFQETKKAILLK